MFYKKIALCSLFLSGQALGMLVNPINKRHMQMPKQKPNLEKFSYEQSLKSQWNYQLFTEKLIPDVLPIIMNNPHLDYSSTARFLMTCEHLYRMYGDKGFALSPETYMKEMISASRANNKKKAELLLARSHTKQRESILQYFKIDSSNLDAVMEIYKKQYDSKSDHPWRVKFGDLAKNHVLCQLLLEQGLCPNMFTEKLNTLLVTAIKWNPETVKVLLADKRTDLNTIQNKDCETALMIAAKNKHIEALELLLADTRVNPNKQNKYDETALMIAAKNKHIEALKLLLADTRVDPNIQDNTHKTALMIAAKCNHTEALKLLLADQRVNPNIQNKYGKTALSTAIPESQDNPIEALIILLADERVDQNTAFYTAHYYMKDSKLVNELFNRASYWKSLLYDPFASGLGYLNLDKERSELLEKFLKKNKVSL